MRVLLKLKQETISTRAGSETGRELRVYKNTFKIFSIDVFIFYQSLRLFPYFRVLSHFKTFALIWFVPRELYRSLVSLWSIRVKKEWNYPSIERLCSKNRHLKGMFGNPIAIVFGIFRSCMFAERKTSILLKKISLTCKYEWLVVTQAAQVHRKKRVLSEIKLVTCVKQSLAQVLRHLCHATPFGCLWLDRRQRWPSRN